MRKLGWVLVAALLASVLSPVGAHAARRVVFKGGGWGHGMGMSQYGAYGRALNGAGAHRILRHYYTGVTIDRRRMPRVRVGLLQGQRVVEAGSIGGDVVFRVAGAKRRIARGGPNARFRLEPSPTGGVRIYRNGRRIERNRRSVFGGPDRPVVAMYERLGSRVHVHDKGTAYAYGRLEFGTARGCSGYCLRLVLRIRMQKYLYGLGEVPSSWPQGALRAQAIAGRTYAYRKARESGRHRIECDCT
ncbi:MAG: SpoIID/LytB domain-containing protein, partial [Candidatus Rokuibacteriota bacterium]